MNVKRALLHSNSVIATFDIASQIAIHTEWCCVGMWLYFGDYLTIKSGDLFQPIQMIICSLDSEMALYTQMR
jgi:hypothetical protein